MDNGIEINNLNYLHYNWYNNIHRHSGICFITPQQCYEGKGPQLMIKRNQIMDVFYTHHKEQKKLTTATGKHIYWKMPEKAVVMPFYTRRSKVKDKIRAAKLDSGENASVGKRKDLIKAS